VPHADPRDDLARFEELGEVVQRLVLQERAPAPVDDDIASEFARTPDRAAEAGEIRSHAAPGMRARHHVRSGCHTVARWYYRDVVQGLIRKSVRHSVLYVMTVDRCRVGLLGRAERRHLARLGTVDAAHAVRDAFGQAALPHEPLVAGACAAKGIRRI